MWNRTRIISVFSVTVILQTLVVIAASAQTNSASDAIRVGLPTTKVQMAQGGGDAAAAVRTTLAADLTGAKIQLVPLDARLPELIQAEAKEKGCAYVFTTSLNLKRGGGGSGVFGRAVGNVTSTAAAHIPGGSVGASVARTETADAVYSVLAGIKARDELELEYKLYPAGAAAPRLAQTEKAKAKQDGEDILSPLVEKAASALLKELTKR